MAVLGLTVAVRTVAWVVFEGLTDEARVTVLAAVTVSANAAEVAAASLVSPL